jgi:hypothetical protein
MEWDTHQLRVVRYWPRPAAWVHVRKLRRWFARVPELWPADAASDEHWQAAEHAGVRRQYLDMRTPPPGRGGRPFDPLVDLEFDPDMETFVYTDRPVLGRLTAEDESDIAPQAEKRIAAQRAAWATVPERVRSVVGGLRDQRAWRVLRFLGHVPGALELFESVPWLAHALLYQALVRERPVRDVYAAARRLLRVPDGWERWRRVAGWLGFEPSRAFVRLVRRMPPLDFNDFWLHLEQGLPAVRPEVLELRQVWADPNARKRLLHAPRVDAEVVSIVCAALRADALRRLHPDLMDAAFAGGVRGGVARTYARLVRAWPILEPGRPVPDIRSAEELDTWFEELRRRVPKPGERLSGPYPPPPLPDTAQITALRTEDALTVEGFQMGHCIGNGTWADRARRLDGFGYAVQVGEERASVWIVRSQPQYTFAAFEFRGPRNEPPGPQVRAAVDSWLTAHREDVQRRGKEALPPEWADAFHARERIGVHDPFAPPDPLLDLVEEEIPF